MKKYLEILNSIALLNYDNGRQFKRRDRLDAIGEILEKTDYKKVNSSGLFELYALNGALPEEAVLISTHIDCAYTITECFVEDYSAECLRGTFDNLITNALAVLLMTEKRFADNVIIAFTGDEEEGSRGARDLVKFLRRCGCRFRTIVLDVTDMGWEDNALFTVENNFWADKLGTRVIDVAKNTGLRWKFVPSDVSDVPGCVPSEVVIYIEALCDESWEYDEYDVECFSLCIPTQGDMHSNQGVLARKEAVKAYADVLAQMANGI